jgi:adenylate kinase
MRLVILGPPGAGKGTQAVRIAQRLRIPQLSTGEMFRAAVHARTKLGEQAKGIMERGGLVPDNIVLRIVAGRIEASDAQSGFILDGFPRTIGQAVEFDEMLAERRLKLDRVLNLRVDEHALFNRIVTRAREMAARGDTVRKDDNPETLRHRLAAYSKETAPLVDYYERQGLLRSVDGLQPIEIVTDQLFAVINTRISASSEGHEGSHPP